MTNDDERKNDNTKNEYDHIFDDPQLTAYALGEIDDADEIARIERLLEENAQARQFVEDIRATGEMLAGELKRESTPALSADEEAAMAREAVATASESTSGEDEADQQIGAPIPFPVMLVRSRTFKLSAGLAAAALVTIVATVATVATVAIINRDQTPKLDDIYAIDDEAAAARDMVQNAAPRGRIAEKRTGGSGESGGSAPATGESASEIPLQSRGGPAPAESKAADSGVLVMQPENADNLLTSEGSTFERRARSDADTVDARGLPERELAESPRMAKGAGIDNERLRADTKQESTGEDRFWGEFGRPAGIETATETDDKIATSPTTSTGNHAAPPEPDASTAEDSASYGFAAGASREGVADELTVLFAEVAEKKKAGDYENALNILGRAKTIADQNRKDLTQDQYETLRRNAVELGEQIEGEQHEAMLNEAELQQKEISETLSVIRRAQREGDYDQAIAQLEELKEKDPGNPAMQALEDALHDLNEFRDSPDAPNDPGARTRLRNETSGGDEPILDRSKPEVPIVVGGVVVGGDELQDAPARELDRLVDRLQQQIENEEYARINDNPFKAAAEEPLSTFSIDVDTASYSNVRRFINEMSMVPPADAVRIEEMINNFDYDYKPPTKDVEHPFAVHTEIGECPWNPDHRLARIGLKGYEVPADDRPATNLVFLIDSSGSMSDQNKLPLVQRSLTELVDNLTVDDRIAIVTYAGESRLVLDSTAVFEHDAIVNAINSLHAGGSTNGEGGLEMAYDIATNNFIEGGVNRVILCTDGDFNVGISDEGGLSRLIEEKRQSNVFLSVLGFGMGNIKDNKLELLADKGNGQYAYIDNYAEAEKLFVDRLSGTLVTIAKDVKIQVDFNPTKVASYRLIGYENRVMAARDFNDDTKDAGEIGAGHTVTALYEIIPAGAELVAQDDVDDSVYVETAPTERAVESGEVLNVRLRYKKPEASESTLWTIPVIDEGKALSETTDDFRFAAGVAEYGMILRQSPYRGHMSYGALLDLAGGGLGKPSEDARGERSEFLSLVRRTREIAPYLFVERDKAQQPAEVEPAPATDGTPVDNEPASEPSDSDSDEHNDG